MQPYGKKIDKAKKINKKIGGKKEDVLKLTTLHGNIRK